MLKPSLANIRKHLEIISRPRDIFQNRGTLLEIEEYIKSEFQSYGYALEIQPSPFEDETFNNVIARSRSLSSSRFIIGAHFDAVPGTPGADDNASGVAALLETARLLANTEAASKIDFITFNAEEYNMIGSSFHVNKLKANKQTLIGMLSLEMIGYTNSRKGSQEIPLPLKPFYPNVGNFLALVGDWNSKPLLKQAENAFKKVNGLPVETLRLPGKGNLLPAARLSDHSPFWDAGYPALLVTDTSFFRNPHYHTSQDRLETLDLEFLSRVTEGIVRLAVLIT